MEPLAKEHSMKIDIGIPEKDRKKIAKGLSQLLADTYTLYVKTHNFHWNVTGPMFNQLHTMFEGQYTELADAVDLIAERIRSLGEPAPGSYAAFARLTTIKEAEGVPEAKEMVRQLVDGNEAIVKTARKVLPLSQGAGDESSTDLVIERLRHHEKTAWMLRSILG